MKVESGAPDELVLVLDVTEVSRLLERKVSPQALAGALPGQAGKLADAVMDEMAQPRPRELTTITSITVRVVQTRVVASETLMLDGERQVYA